MNKFCRECGKEVIPNNKVCIHCGVPYVKGNTKPTRSMQTSARKPMTAKQKMIWGILAGIIILVGGFSVWANSYHSSSSVLKRFEAAIDSNDSGKVKKMMIHQQGTSISEEEAKAFLKLVEQIGKNSASKLFDVDPYGKFLGVFQDHKIKGVDQFVAYGRMIEGLSFEFAGKAFPTSERGDEHVVYGPFAPGVYAVEAIFKGDYGSTSKEDLLTLDDYYGEHSWIEMDIPVSYVTFYVDNYHQIDTSKSYILLNNQKLPISEDGESEEVGPFILDGNQEVKIVATMPWGEVESESFTVDNAYMYIYASLISDTAYKGMQAIVKDFGEQYVQAMAETSIEPFTVVSSDRKRDLESYLDHNYFYSGKLNSIEMDKDSIHIEKMDNIPSVWMDVRYMVEESYHEITEKPELYSEDLFWRIGLTIDKDTKSWIISGLSRTSMWGGFDATDTLEGSKTLHGPSEDTVAKAELLKVKEELEHFILNYTRASVIAINYRDFSYVSSYITEDGPRKQEASEYIEYLDSKDIYEDFLGSEIEKVEKLDDNSWKVTIVEEFEIHKPDSSSTNKFRTIIVVKLIDDEYYVDELIETKEI